MGWDGSFVEGYMVMLLSVQVLVTVTGLPVIGWFVVCSARPVTSD